MNTKKRLGVLAMSVLLVAPLVTADIDLEPGSSADISVPAGTMSMIEGEFQMDDLPALISYADTRTLETIQYEMDWVIEDSTAGSTTKEMTWRLIVTAVSVVVGVDLVETGVTLGSVEAQEVVSWSVPIDQTSLTGTLAVTLDVPESTDMITARMSAEHDDGTLRHFDVGSILWRDDGDSSSPILPVVATDVDGTAVLCDVNRPLAVQDADLVQADWGAQTTKFDMALAKSSFECDLSEDSESGTGVTESDDNLGPWASAGHDKICDPRTAGNCGVTAKGFHGSEVPLPGVGLVVGSDGFSVKSGSCAFTIFSCGSIAGPFLALAGQCNVQIEAKTEQPNVGSAEDDDQACGQDA